MYRNFAHRSHNFIQCVMSPERGMQHISLQPCHRDQKLENLPDQLARYIDEMLNIREVCSVRE